MQPSGKLTTTVYVSSTCKMSVSIPVSGIILTSRSIFPGRTIISIPLKSPWPIVVWSHPGVAGNASGSGLFISQSS